ncbi:hypothetical protein [Parvibaculum sp.]|uniref:hypothetical protein n=1 Tax=Parvibaculum sp. TaxID=2024848 RepID=UPI003296E33C
MASTRDNRAAGQSVFEKSVFGIANVAAVIMTYLATPFVFDLSIDWIEAFTREHYGRDAADLIELPWFALSGLTVFFVSRATVGVAITIGGLALASRVF